MLSPYSLFAFAVIIGLYSPEYDTLLMAININISTLLRPPFELSNTLGAIPPALALLLPLIPPATLVQAKRNAPQHKEREEVPEAESLGLEHGLHERQVDEPELHEKRGRDSCDEHSVLRQPTAKTAILDRCGQIKEDETSEGLKFVREHVRLAR